MTQGAGQTRALSKNEDLMPSRSRAQHNAMEAAAHNPKLRRKLGIPQDVAEEFVHADENDKDYKRRERVKKAAEQAGMTEEVFTSVFGTKPQCG